MAVWVAKALGLQPVDTAEIPFKDAYLIAPEDVGYIMALYKEGLIAGTPGGKFNPNSAITRAELAAIMERLLAKEAGGEEEVEGPAESEVEEDENDETSTGDETAVEEGNEAAAAGGDLTEEVAGSGIAL